MKTCCRLRFAKWLLTTAIAWGCASAQAQGVFVIEAEDFDHGGGQHLAVVDTMPYLGGAYHDLAAVHEVDYHRVSPIGEVGPDVYRRGEDPNVGFMPIKDMDRGLWSVSTNWRICCHGRGDWYNYTRVFPSGNYRVYVAMSSGYPEWAEALHATLDKVAGGAGTPNQTLTPLGIFRGLSSGSWESNRLLPLTTPDGSQVVIRLDGATTFRLTASLGDVDYLRFVNMDLPGVFPPPTNSLAMEGDTIRFKTSASGAPPLTYRWRFWRKNELPAFQDLTDTTRVVGANTTELTIRDTGLADEGRYQLVVSNSLGSATSESATLSLIPRRPVITTQPSHPPGMFDIGQIGVSASGATPLSYQWYFRSHNPPRALVDDGRITGCTSSTLNIRPLRLEDAGNYFVVVSNAWGSATSLDYLEEPDTLSSREGCSNRLYFIEAEDFGNFGWGTSIDCMPYYGGAFRNRGGTFDVDYHTSRYDNPAGYRPDLPVFGGGSLDRGNWKMVENYYIGMTQPGDWFNFYRSLAGTYKVFAAMRGAGTNRASLHLVTSNFADKNQSLLPIGTFEGPGTAANAPFTLVPLTMPDGSPVNLEARGMTCLRFTVTAGDIDYLRFEDLSPLITRQPNYAERELGQAVTFNVEASGTGPFTYQWRHRSNEHDPGTWLVDDEKYSGATSPSLSIAEVGFEDESGYDVVVRNAYGSDVSARATIRILDPATPRIAGQPQDLEVDPSEFGRPGFGVDARCRWPLSYQWRLNGIDLAPVSGQGGSTNDYQHSSMSPFRESGSPLPPEGEYDVVISSIAGSITSRVARLSFVGSSVVPRIAVQPQGSHVAQGGAAVLKVTAFCSIPMAYQWLRGGLPLPGATNAALTIANAQSVDAGTYSVEVWSYSGSVTSYGADLSVLIPPAIAIPPQSQIGRAGNAVTFNATATGTPPLYYQWSFNGAVLAGANSPTLTLTGLRANQAGPYRVTVTNEVGSATSSPAELAVIDDAARVLRLLSTNALAGGSLSVPVLLAAQGNENAAAFSIGFDTNFLSFSSCSLGSGASGAMLNMNTNLAASGRVGFMIALPAGEVFAPGPRELAVLSFHVAPGVGDLSVPIAFGNQPLSREITDAQANAVLTTFLDGSISVDAGFEADVTPLPYGNGSVTITDWVKVGRYAAGLDTISSPSQFQKADCSPKATLGGGTMTISDWVQAGRYAAGLDPLVKLGGPIAATGFMSSSPARTGLSPSGEWNRIAPQGSSGARLVRVTGGSAFPGQSETATIQVQAGGDENALGLSLAFDPTLLWYQGAEIGTGVVGGTLNVNTNQITSGRLGLALTLPIGAVFPAGTRELVRVRFGVLATAGGGEIPLTLVDGPVQREVSDALANALTAGYESGVMTVLAGSPTALRFHASQTGPGGTLRLELGNADGTDLDPGRAPKIEVWATTNLGLGLNTWFRVTNPVVLSGGMLQMHDVVDTNSLLRFFRVSEQP